MIDKKENMIIFFIITICVVFTSYFSFFLSIILISLLLPFFNNPLIRFISACFIIINLSYLMSDFVAESDSLQYLNYFKTLYFNLWKGEQLQSRTLEVAWQFYIRLLTYISTPDFFFFCNTLALYSLAMYSSYKLGGSNYLMIFLLFCFLGFSNSLNFLIRQYYSSVFILIFFIFFERKIFYKVIIFLISFGFHSSAIIYLPLLNKKIVNYLNNKAILILSFSFLLSFVIDLDSVIFIYEKFQGSIVVDRLRYYNNLESSSSIFSLYFFEKILVLFLILKVNVELLTKTEIQLRALFIYSFSLALIFSNISILSERLGMISMIFLGLFLFIPIKYASEVRFFKIRINPILIFYFYLPLRILFWGISNENTHNVKYFDGQILSIGFHGFFSNIIP